MMALSIRRFAIDCYCFDAAADTAASAIPPPTHTLLHAVDIAVYALYVERFAMLPPHGHAMLREQARYYAIRRFDVFACRRCGKRTLPLPLLSAAAMRGAER